MFNKYIKNVLKRFWPDLRLSKVTCNIINIMIVSSGNKIIRNAILLINHINSKSFTPRDIQSSVRITLNNELAKHAVSEGIKAITKYQTNKGIKGSKAYLSGL